MVQIGIKYNYNFGGVKWYYGNGILSGVFDIGFFVFVVDYLNKFCQCLVFDMLSLWCWGGSLVWVKLCVDIGKMKFLVIIIGDFDMDILKIFFGWESFNLYYVLFQEFGMRIGIILMMVVLDVFNQVMVEFQVRIGG